MYTTTTYITKSYMIATYKYQRLHGITTLCLLRRNINGPYTTRPYKYHTTTPHKYQRLLYDLYA